MADYGSFAFALGVLFVAILILVKTAIVVPQGFDANDVIRTAYHRYNLSLGAGLSKVAGKVFRIGHLGYLNEIMVLQALGGAELAMRDVGIPFEPGVGVYMDDVFIARPQGALLDVYDVESIEVLRGPQGTLYGRNAIGGAINVVLTGGQMQLAQELVILLGGIQPLPGLVGPPESPLQTPLSP